MLNEKVNRRANLLHMVTVDEAASLSSVRMQINVESDTAVTRSYEFVVEQVS